MIVVARVLAGLQAVFYAVVWFGVVDLLTVFVQRGPEWHDGYLLEAGWGLFFLVLVAVPFAVLAVRPGHPGALAGLTIAAAALVVGGLWATEGPQVLNGLALAAGVAAVGGLGGWQAPQRRSPEPLLALLAGVGLAGALLLGWDTIEHAVMLDDVTNGVDHSGVQASLGLAVAASVGLAALTTARLPAWSAAACVVWLAGVSLAYPDIEGSLGTPGAVAALAWSALVAAGLLRLRR